MTSGLHTFLSAATDSFNVTNNAFEKFLNYDPFSREAECSERMDRRRVSWQ
jgi:hypothetical protein